MKISTDSFFAGAFFATLIVTLSLFSGIAHAETCTPPPDCSLDGPVSVSSGDGGILQGNISGNSITIEDPGVGTFSGILGQFGSFSATDQLGDTLSGNVTIPDSCSGVNYAAEQLTYETCQQTENPSYDSSGNQLYCYAPVTTDCNQGDEGGIAILNNLNGTPGLAAGEVTACEDRHTQYEVELATYNTCLSSKAQSQSTTPIPTNSLTPTPRVAVTGVTLNESSNTLTVGGATDSLMVTILPDHVPYATNQNFTWSSSDPSIASVDDDVITAVAPGSATITVTTADGNFTATDNITVVDPANDSTTATNDSLVAQARAYFASQGYTPPALTTSIAPTSATSWHSQIHSPYLDNPSSTPASSSSWHSQVKLFGSTPTTSVATATTTQSVASSTAAPAPKQKHWYEWLNPINWFSWIR